MKKTKELSEEEILLILSEVSTTIEMSKEEISKLISILTEIGDVNEIRKAIGKVKQPIKNTISGNVSEYTEAHSRNQDPSLFLQETRDLTQDISIQKLESIINIIKQRSSTKKSDQSHSNLNLSHLSEESKTSSNKKTDKLNIIIWSMALALSSGITFYINIESIQSLLLTSISIAASMILGLILGKSRRKK